MRILISNDDGYQAQGLRLLADGLRELAEVTVVAPDRNCSGASNSLTLEKPLRVEQVEEDVYSVNGTPTDCVHLAITGLLGAEPDMVISGVNHGANLGDDVLYSGTVAAAMEGRFLGLAAMAVSLAGEHGRHFETAVTITQRLVRHMVQNPLPRKTILNINVPDCPVEALKGIRTTRLGCRHKAEPVVPARDPKNRLVYWVGPAGPGQDVGEGTDFCAVSNGWVSVSPIKVDFTDHSALQSVESWLDRLE
ncbi:MAG: 5'/3'-nucleotidase SurE [Gammaproteobacteria bacterium]